MLGEQDHYFTLSERRLVSANLSSELNPSQHLKDDLWLQATQQHVVDHKEKSVPVLPSSVVLLQALSTKIYYVLVAQTD